MTDNAISRAQAMLARVRNMPPFLVSPSDVESLRGALSALLGEVSELHEERDDWHREYSEMKEKLERAQDSSYEQAGYAAAWKRRAKRFLGDRNAAREYMGVQTDRIRGLMADVNTLTDRLNDMEAANIRRASSTYVEQQERAALEAELAKLKVVPQACFERPGGCSCWKAGDK